MCGPEFLASRQLIQDASVYRGLAGFGLVLGAYGTGSDLVTGEPNVFAPLFGC
jgi:hypothetical protein